MLKKSLEKIARDIPYTLTSFSPVSIYDVLKNVSFAFYQGKKITLKDTISYTIFGNE